MRTRAEHMDSIVSDLRCSRADCMHSFFFFHTFPLLLPTQIQAHWFEYIIHTHSRGQWLNKKQDPRPDLLGFLCPKTDVTKRLKHTCCIYQGRAAADRSRSVNDICVSLSPRCVCERCRDNKKRHVNRGCVLLGLLTAHCYCQSRRENSVKQAHRASRQDLQEPQGKLQWERAAH